MKIVLAPDSFKGNLTSLQVACAFEEGIKRVIPNANCIKIPMADGGEGTVQSLVDATGGKFIRKKVKGATGALLFARYGILSDKKTAVIEMSEASGLPSVEGTKNKNPLETTTYGTGQLMMDAINKGANHIILGLGGSATIDGGAGMAQALGIKFLDKRGLELKELGAGGMLNRIANIDMSRIDSRIKRVKITVASDVNNPFCGKNGAAYIFGSQKGATPTMISKLDANLKYFAAIIKRDLRKDVMKLKWAGAAGGLGAGLAAFTGAKLKSGIDIIIQSTGLENHIKNADLVITGEGRVDFQTAFGKTPAGVARIARKQKVQTVVIGGGITDDARDVFEHGIDGLASACARDMSLEEAMNYSRAHLANAAERVIRLVLIGKKLSKPKKYKRK